MSARYPLNKPREEYLTTVFIDKDPDNLWKGWGWVDIKIGVVMKYGIDKSHPRPRIIHIEEIPSAKRASFLKGKCQSNYGYKIKPPSRGRTGGKKFTIQIGDENISIKVQKSLTIKAIVAWVKTWAGEEAKIITPGGKTISTKGEIESSKTEFIYFILNKENNAVKIGRAKDVEKRLKALQTANCNELALIKTIRVNGSKEARELERSLHQKYNHLRLSGEWFKVSEELFDIGNFESDFSIKKLSH